jgi:hypothetical protein
MTYFLTVPFVAAAILALLVFREPRLHRTEESEPLRRQLATTYRTILERGGIRIVVLLTVLTGCSSRGCWSSARSGWSHSQRPRSSTGRTGQA